MPDTFNYKCSQCGESLTLPISLLGQQGECPFCQNVELLQDASMAQSTTVQSVNDTYPDSPFGGAPVTAETVTASTNPFLSPRQETFQFASVNPDHRGKLGTMLWGIIIAFCLTFVWGLYIIAAPIFGIFSENPERFDRLTDDEAGVEFLYSLAEQTSPFKRTDVENLSEEEALETAFFAIATGMGMGTKALGCIVLWCIGAICYLIFFHTLWTQIQDDPRVKFSPPAIVGYHFIPVGIGLAGVMLTSVSPILIILFNLIALIVWWGIMFITYWKLADHMEKYRQQQGIVGRPAPAGLALIFCIMQIAAIAPLVGPLLSLVGFVLWFIVVFQLKNSAIDIINHKIQTEQTGSVYASRG